MRNALVKFKMQKIFCLKPRKEEALYGI